jgi:ABC-type bacteriocin/lantibiotic exporter with double-glycine peptidase domain
LPHKKRATVLFFDEATSALDVETERAVIESIRDLDPNLTIVIVAHRLTTVAYCDVVVTLKIGEPGLTVAIAAERAPADEVEHLLGAAE